MNFFGHALVAAHERSDPRFVLGSMLPDLASILRARVPSTNAAAIRDGVAFHHATDRAFHDSEGFLRLSREASRWLGEQGVRRGTARAVAHVGVEYLIDAELMGLLEGGIPSYQAALSEGSRVGAGIAWANAVDELRFARLCTDIGGAGTSIFAGGVSSLVRRLHRALGQRPRLAILGDDTLRVEQWAQFQSGRVATEVPALLAELSGALGVTLPAAQIR